jgi:hypothetical protein
MERKLIDEAIKHIEDEAKRFQKLRPAVIQYTSDRNWVSLDYDFELGKIPMTIIAKRDKWEQLNQLYYEQELTFESVEPFISKRKTRKQERDRLNNYSRQDPDLFNEEMKKCIDRALYELRPNKPRGRVKEQLNASTRMQVNRISCQLYHYIKHCYRNNRRKEVLRLFKKYNFGNDITAGRHKDFVMNVIEQEFKIKPQNDPEEFYRSYIRSYPTLFKKYQDYGFFIRKMGWMLKGEATKNTDAYYLQRILSNERFDPMK